MEDKFKFSNTVYEVVSEQTHKYAATSIAGGEMGRQVHSLVTHYSDQGLWLRDVSTGKERKFEFNTFNIAARDGHKLLCIWHDPSGDLEAVKNINTNDLILGINDFKQSNLATWPGTITMAVVFGVFFLIPFFAAIVLFLAFAFAQTPVGRLKTNNIPYYRTGLLIGALFYLVLDIILLSYGMISDAIFKYVVVMFIVNFAAVFTMHVVAKNYVATGRERLLAYISELT